MKGNWSGPYQGTNAGTIIVEMDDRDTFFQGCVYAYDEREGIPTVFSIVRTPSRNKKQNFNTQISFLDPRTGEPCDWRQIAGLFDTDVQVPTKADVKIEWNKEALELWWTTDIGTSGSARLAKSDAQKPSAIVAEPVGSWEEFKRLVLALEPNRYAFRGQSNNWRLRTPFHRTGRGDLLRFFREDVAALHRHLSARTRHLFNLADPLQYAAFLHLAQHHGYPTPLLDWTYSPFVAAYFAFRRISPAELRRAKSNRKVRIFMLDRQQWCADFNQIQTVAVRKPHFSIIEPIALGNERLIPQQALSSFTTVDDIETYIQSKQINGKIYLRAFDLPLDERAIVDRELNLMGISAGSLFPGLDGACEELRERFFKL